MVKHGLLIGMDLGGKWHCTSAEGDETRVQRLLGRNHCPGGSQRCCPWTGVGDTHKVDHQRGRDSRQLRSSFSSLRYIRLEQLRSSCNHTSTKYLSMSLSSRSMSEIILMPTGGMIWNDVCGVVRARSVGSFGAPGAMLNRKFSQPLQPSA